jgi:hypothetical protein
MNEKIRINGVDGYRGRPDETIFPIVKMGEAIKRVTINFLCLPARWEEKIFERKKR